MRFKIVDLSLDEGGSTGDEPAIIVLAPRHAVRPSSPLLSLANTFLQTPSPALAPLLARLSTRSTEFEIALLVTLPHFGDSELDEDAWEDLALEHGFEWVDGKKSEVVEQEEAEDGEQKGIARVVGALHAHMWEGMVRETPEGRRAKMEGVEEVLDEDEEDEEDKMGLGAPPLPEPRPFVPTPLAFPSTFLPSLARSSSTSTSTTSSLPPAAASTPSAASFDDDFAPFVPTLSTSSFPPLSPTELSATILSPTSPTPLHRHPELSFPDTEALFGSEGEEEDLLELVEKLRGLREVGKGMGVQERRAMAEKVVMGLLGE